MRTPETTRARIEARLRSDGWSSEGGTKHEKYVHADRAETVWLPRHKVISIGVARSIAKAAGWA